MIARTPRSTNARPEVQPDPTPEEIREMCRQIREAGGQAWERARWCYRSPSVSVPTVRVSGLDRSMLSTDEY